MFMKTLRDADSIPDRILPRKYEMNITLAILIIATAGAFLQIGGGSWDITDIREDSDVNRLFELLEKD